MSVAASIEQKLTEAFSPTLLEVIDESHHHAGHAGNPGGGESHFRIRIQAEAFAGKPRVAQLGPRTPTRKPAGRAAG
jgi:BolA protein